MSNNNIKLTIGEVYEINYQSIKSCVDTELAHYFTTEIFKYYMDEVGIDLIADYVELQEEINQHLDMGFDPEEVESYYSSYNKFKFNDVNNESEDEDGEDVFKNIMAKKNTKYNLPLIKDKLQRCFIRELVENIPVNKVLITRDDVVNFIKTFEQEFLYEFLIPIGKKGKKYFN